MLIRRSPLQRAAARVVIAMTALVATAGYVLLPAAATPATSTTGVTLSKQTVGGKDYIVSDITITPGGSTGWQVHQGEVFGIVKAGTLTHYTADCRQDGVYTAGDPITDPTGSEHAHIGRNLGTVPVILEVAYIDPAGAPTSDSAPNPGCDFA